MDINIKKEVLNEGANGLVEDARFNRPAKDGEEGATVESNGAILLKNQETIPVDEENIQPTMATENSAKGNIFTDNLLWFIIGGVALAVRYAESVVAKLINLSDLIFD